MENTLIILVLVLIIGVALAYVYREKKKGAKCVGCPYSKECSKKNCSDLADNR
ncbi:MAG: FeoB-associated Cys-rich membrane protein [Clostridia bacterium]|nr:FeoB-associated Cys-rich membrane protein [Clostridia bacterium]